MPQILIVVLHLLPGAGVGGGGGGDRDEERAERSGRRWEREGAAERAATDRQPQTDRLSGGRAAVLRRRGREIGRASRRSLLAR